MEPVAATSLAANVIQLLEFASRVIKRLHEFRDNHGEVPKIFKGITTRLPLLVEDLKKCYHGDELENESSPLSEVLTSCQIQIGKLNGILADVLPLQEDSWATKNRKALLSMKKEKVVNRIDVELRQCMELLTFHHVLPRQINTLQKVDSGLGMLDEDLTIPCRYYEVPPKRVAHFFGREGILQEIGERFKSNNMVIVQGMGGQGKTQVALEFCRRAQESSLYEGIFWMDASSEGQLRRSFKAIVDIFKQPEHVFDTTERGITFVKERIQSLTHSWLMVFDNYDDPVGFPHITEFVPGGAGHVLFTTRHADVSRYGTSLMLGGLEESESLEMLFHRLGCARDAETVQHATSVVKRLGCHPLALDQAAAYISKRKATLNLAKFVEHYNKRRKDILKSTPKVWEYRKKRLGEDQDRSLSVFTTWEMSFNRLTDEVEHGEHYADLLTLLAYCHNGDISESLFSAFWSRPATARSKELPTWLSHFTENGSWSQERFQDALVELCGLSLIESQYRDNQDFLHVSLHPLVRDWVQMRASPESRYQQTLLQANLLDSYIESAHPGAFFQFPTDGTESVFSHLTTMAENHKEHIRPLLKIKDIDLLADVYGAFAAFLQFCYRLPDAEMFLRLAVEVLSPVAETAIGRILPLQSWLGSLCGRQGRYQEAETVLGEVEDVFLTLSCGDPPERIRNIVAFGESLIGREMYSEALDMLHGIALRARKSLGDIHPLTFHSLSRLATVMQIQGELTKALEIYKEILEHNRGTLGDDHPRTLIDHYNFATVLAEQGKFKESAKIHNRCLSLRTEKLGKQHPETLLSAQRLGIDWLNMGRYQDAEELLEKTSILFEDVHGYDDLRTMYTLDCLCIAYLRNGKLEKATETGERCLTARNLALGPDHPHTFHSSRTLALVLSEKGQHDHAERLLCEVSQGQKLRFGDNHHEILRTQHELAVVLRNAGRHEEAKRMFLQVWKKREQVLGMNYPQIYLSAVNYALLLDQSTHWKEVQEVLQEAQDKLDTALDSTHPIFVQIAQTLKKMKI